MKNLLKISNVHAYGRVICDKEWQVNEDCPTYHRIYYVYGGEAIYQDASQSLSLKPRHLYIFSALKKYCITHNQIQPLECLFFHIDFNQIILNTLVSYSIIDDTAEGYTVQLLNSLIKAKDQLNIEQALNILISQIIGSVKIVHVTDPRIQTVIESIHKNLDKMLTNKQLARQINVDQRYFIRLFSANCGITPKQYIQQHRLFRACQMLQQDFRINEISEALGFTDAKEFSRFFKHHKGLAPSLYRESYFLLP